MATKENINWKRINKGDILPCQSFLRKKDGEILKLSTVGGVKVGQDCYYLPVDEVINVIKDYPIEESKDERIRKVIYNCVKWFGFDSSFFEDVSQEECLDWLEKQGQTFTKKDVDDAYLKGICDAKHELEKQGEQKSADLKTKAGNWYICDEEVMNENMVAAFRPNEIYYCPKDGYLDVGGALFEVGYLDVFRLVTEKEIPQPKQEWSKEDKVILDEIIDFFENGTVKLQHDLSLYASWLKSLKERVQTQPQKQWKPSKEQMEGIECTIKTLRYQLNAGDNRLESLYQDLKKIREE